MCSFLLGMQRLPLRRRRGKAAKKTGRSSSPPHPGPVCLALLCLVTTLGLIALLRAKAFPRHLASLSLGDSAPAPVDADCWVFQHLHKSGGMTIRRIMNPPKGDLEEDGDIVGYGTDEWRLGRAFWDETLSPQLLHGKRYRVATGGYTGALRLSPGLARGCRFFTVFRHPVNRLVSAFYWCRSPKHSWDPLCASSVMDSTKASLVDFARHWGNYGARQLAMAFIPAEDVLRYVDETVGDDRPALLDGVPVEDIPSWFLLKAYLRHSYPRGGGGGGGDGGRPDGIGEFNDDAALASLLGPIQDLVRDNYTAIGVVEEFDASMALFDRAGVLPGKTWADTYGKLGAANRNEAHETEGGAVLRRALVSDEVKRYLRLDILLYDHALAVFHGMVSQDR